MCIIEIEPALNSWPMNSLCSLLAPSSRYTPVKFKFEVFMKKLFILLFLLMTLSLIGQDYETILITDEEDLIQLAGREAVRITGSEIYLTYLDYDESENSVKVTLAYSNDNGQNFQKMEIDEMGTTDQFPNLDEPVLELMDDGTVIIIYNKLDDGIKNLYRARSDQYLNDFDIQLIEENITGEIHLIEKNDILTLTYQKADTTGIDQFSFFQHFSDKEHSVNADGGIEATMMKFWGPDVFEGPVHSNSDIWIQQAGGGNNGGWPTFYGPVTTAGIFRGYPTGIRLEDSGAPMEYIFQGGWEENVPYIDLPDTAEEIRENGLRPFEQLNADIVYVSLDGNSYVSMIGYRELVRVDSFKVFSWYPHDPESAQEVINNDGNWFEDTEHIWTNYVPRYHLNWVEGPTGNVNNHSVWVESELWITGEVGGMQTWGCADTVFITGDIYYTNTAVGDSPNDEDNPNVVDYFGLVSEEQILIKYKHFDPWTNEIRDDNCTDIYLYGAYAALGKGDTLVYGNQACHFDGIFSYEYQHPHGSTPDFNGIDPYTGIDTMYSYIDFHKYIYPSNDMVPENLQDFILHGNNPPTGLPCGYPYESNEYINSYPNNSLGVPNYIYQTPYGTDLPLYNPVWPESAEDIVFERGEINLFGSMNQRRRGFVHRSGSDPYNHESNEWNLDNFQFDGLHPSTGYSKDYHYDSRLLTTELIDYPSMEGYYYDRDIEVCNSLDGGESFDQPYTFSSDIPFILNRTYFSENEEKIIMTWQNSYRDIRVYESLDNGLQFDLINEINMSEFDVMHYQTTNLTEENTLYLTGISYFLDRSVNKLDLNSNNFYQIYYDPYYHFVSDFNITNDGAKIFCSFIYGEFPEYLSIRYSFDDQLDNEVQWMPEVVEEMIIDDLSEFILTFDESDSLYLFFYAFEQYMNEPRSLFLIKGSIEGITPETEDVVPVVSTYLSIFPNPFNPDTEIEFSLMNDSDVELSVYNIKGQKVQKLIDQNLPKGVHSTKWNGTDSLGLPASSGIYFLKFKNKEKEIFKKLILLK
jgi:type IX secretion system substrate protein